MTDSSRPISVLVVDDEEPVRKFVDRVMREAGYSTAQAGDGVEALEVASKTGTVDILVTDVMMPHMLGDELARRLRQSEPGLKVLYLTGYERPTLEDIKRFRQLGSPTAGHPENFELAGVEPLAHKIVVVKSTIHYRAAFEWLTA